MKCLTSSKRNDRKELVGTIALVPFFQKEVNIIIN
jgi:hypothetical protein